MHINRDYTVTVGGTAVPITGWGVISAEAASQYPLDEYARANEIAEATGGFLAPIIDIVTVEVTP